MKTTKIFSVLSLALIFCATLSVSSAPIGNKDGKIAVNQMVRHQVNIIALNDRKLCNFYLVEILDGNGRLVAPAKSYNPGVSTYDFYERGPAEGFRVAVLVLGPVYSHFQCETELFTSPAMVPGPFVAGQTYRYDLYPQSEPSRR
ncbi:MAG: hypothetical protein WCJ26_10655 [bacterium]